MKRLTIIKDDNTVGIDGLFFEIDCSDLPSNFHALQWYEDNNQGEVEWKGTPKPQNTLITDLIEYQKYVDSWNTIKTSMESET